MRRDPDHLRQAAELFAQHRTPLVIASVGSPAAVMPILRDGGVKVLCDVASMRHVEKALELGVDGLVLLTAGAGGNTGWANPFAFVRAVRRIYDGPVVLSGGVSDGVALRAAIALGCTLVNVGTRFIATRESLASDAYRQMLVASSLDDVVRSKAVTGLEANWLRGSLVAAGLDPDELAQAPGLEEARARYGRGNASGAPERWSGIWSAGHSVAGVSDAPSVAEVVRRMQEELEGSPAQDQALA
jgi:nitronate monooxygenase